MEDFETETENETNKKDTKKRKRAEGGERLRETTIPAREE
jgi:hypothetical protein